MLENVNPVVRWIDNDGEANFKDARLYYYENGFLFRSHKGDDSIRINYMAIRQNGMVGIGNTNPTQKLAVAGNIIANGHLYVSDKRLKKNIKPIETALDKIKNIDIYSYDVDKEKYPNKKLPEGKHYGVMAQELEEIIPELVSTDSEGYKAVDYGQMVPFLVEAIKEQQKQIEDLQKAVGKL